MWIPQPAVIVDVHRLEVAAVFYDELDGPGSVPGGAERPSVNMFGASVYTSRYPPPSTQPRR